MYEVIVKVNFFPLGYPIDLVPYTEKIILPPTKLQKFRGAIVLSSTNVYTDVTDFVNTERFHPASHMTLMTQNS